LRVCPSSRSPINIGKLQEKKKWGRPDNTGWGSNGGAKCRDKRSLGRRGKGGSPREGNLSIVPFEYEGKRRKRPFLTWGGKKEGLPNSRLAQKKKKKKAAPFSAEKEEGRNVRD